ncbi:MAG: hypothetical protein EPO22_03535 [Dehalococcoidia bacterium]|nr:MAG: hypothetical protein EPO22_03535 [Dehalococcoidia bacterium]
MQSTGTLTLIGSGELGPSMRRVHRAIAGRISGAVRPVFLDTPAGFEPNVGDIAARAAAYVEQQLGAPCEIASYTHLSTPAEREHALGVLRTANYIFAGPGSPSYAVRLLRDSPALEVIAGRLRQGAHVVCASAAAIALGTRSLPVYEIYKAGADLHWLAGLDVLSGAGIQLAVVPHWNNAEGGAHDTNCCYMGRTRFEQLSSMLDPAIAVLGIDEHTACTLDLARGECTVMGVGSVTVRRDGREQRFGAGDVCALDELRAVGTEAAGTPRADSSARDGLRARLVRETARAREQLRQHDGLTSTAALAFALAGEIESGAEAGIDEVTIAEGRAELTRCVRVLSRELGEGSGGDDGLTASLIDLLIGVRTRLRSEDAWDLADAVRDGLTSLGVVIEDGPDGTAWHRRE